MLDYFNYDRTIRLFCLLNDFMLGMLVLQGFLILSNFFFYLLHSIVMTNIFLQHKMKCLTNAGGFTRFIPLFLHS